MEKEAYASSLLATSKLEKRDRGRKAFFSKKKEEKAGRGGLKKTKSSHERRSKKKRERRGKEKFFCSFLGERKGGESNSRRPKKDAQVKACQGGDAVARREEGQGADAAAVCECTRERRPL